MNSEKRFYGHLLSVFIITVALLMTAGPASSGVMDEISEGEVAAQGTDLHALGSKALKEGIGGICYFTNGDGDVMAVRAKTMDNGELRVITHKVTIPKDYVADTQKETLELQRTRDRLTELASQQPWVGGYAVLPQNEGMKAYQLGVTVESEGNMNIDREIE